jgi:signal peptidase II
MREVGRWFALALAVAIADQLSKWMIVHSIAGNPPLVVTSFFSLVLVHNPGAAFSFLANAAGWQCAFFIAIALVATIVIAFLIVRHRAELLFCCGLALILGGAVGNVIDRIRLCAVVDFLLFHWREYSFPAFNVADSFITVGAGFLILDALMKSRDEAASSRQ